MAPDAISEEVPTSVWDVILVASFEKEDAMVGKAMKRRAKERLHTDVITSTTRKIFHPQAGLVRAAIESKASGSEAVEKFRVAALHFLCRLKLGYLAYRIGRRVIDEVGIFSRQLCLITLDQLQATTGPGT